VSNALYWIPGVVLFLALLFAVTAEGHDAQMAAIAVEAWCSGWLVCWAWQPRRNNE
jgi:hypothetical protein